MELTAEQKYQQALEQDRARQRLWDKENAEKLDGQDQENHKMGWGMFSIAFILSAIADIVEFFTVGTLGWFVGLIVDLILLAMLGFSKAGKQQWKKWIWGPVIEKIPVLSLIPFRIAFLIWAFVASRSEKLQKVQGAVESIGRAGELKAKEAKKNFEDPKRIAEENRRRYGSN